MAWHVLSSTYFDFDRFARESKADNLPEHLLPKVAGRLDATIHQPRSDASSRLDRLGALLYAYPEHWALARRVYPLLADGDAVYTAGCDGGIPLALLCGLRRRSVSFAIAFSDTSRPRTRLLGWLLVLLGVRLTAVVTTGQQAATVRQSFGRRIAGVHVIDGQTDCNFFRPAAERVEHEPPLVASSGVERRDYATMATALADRPIEARVCFASPNQTAKTRYTLPDPVPENFDFSWLEFIELRDLYQQADVVVVPLLENRYSAGLTTLFEAMACGAPVVVTESPGIIQELIDLDLVLGVPVGDDRAMKAAVDRILGNRAEAMARAAKARQYILDNYSAQSFLERLASILTDFQQPSTTP